MTKNKQFHHGDLKTALLRAARDLLDEGGETGVGVRAVARKVGVSHAAPVNHFKDRRTLLTALTAELIDDVRADIDLRLKVAPKDPFVRIEAIATAFIDYGVRHPNRYALLWRYDVVDHESEMMRSRSDVIYELICNEIDILASGRNIDRDTIAIGLWSMVHGYIDLKTVGMFEDRNDSVTGDERPKALIKMFRTVLDNYGLNLSK
ncbi:putative TetR-family transcriptional regulator [Algimonas ampicilliniresistens]|uniref:TetR-family transcriptional regulator n=1 Tax=Algimonas ampicilliniresistens TaxID=1298735 RepID=A0ABQ5VBP5_9PROT|nr:TetR/AcrR family transcriptional regulator [Algimonas ampicilliniresistens]GLQ24233.1 putative TetR-family transcriptional regulator [Algimonas ampicilliniresistens]